MLMRLVVQFIIQIELNEQYICNIDLVSVYINLTQNYQKLVSVT